MKPQNSLQLRKTTSESSPFVSFNSSKKTVRAFTEKFIEHHSKIDTGFTAQDNVRYLYNEAMALQKLKKMVSLYESLETDLHSKGVQISAVNSLTPQEETIITLIAEGLQTKQIASALFISEHTVQTHRKNIYKKLNVTSVTDLVKIAMMLAVH